ncbi:4-hydroxythreonine-4-phosphate dehydrogenase [hydrothermal vent metagenome]|uniref:4-hydroxythreonine-4-phosphate dehydrogenase n=1 Tax=hydrothermal vent metagenome TaxID=652676 RepID=A0A3B0WPE5_9ZZZZ
MTNKIVITSGEPAGIGPDICLNLLSHDYANLKNTEIYIIADVNLFIDRAKILNIPLEYQLHDDMNNLSQSYQKNKLNIIPLALNTHCQAGQLNADNSQYVLKMLDLACDLCLQQKVDAMVTGPIQKSIINEAGILFTGHTEYLADRSKTTPVMMLATKTLRVALATTHLPISKVSQAITEKSLSETLYILNNFLKNQVGIAEPEILVCGLNPHAGEDGNLGEEEIHTISPVIKKLKQQGLKITGPLPADTLFTDRYLDHADAVLAMYHDQGLPVLKFSGFGKAVNITLGLPFIRTSVDHGTALDLAATGQASDTSLLEAITMAIDLSNTRTQ